MQLSKKDFKNKLDSWEYKLLDVRTTHEQLIYWVITPQQLHIDIYAPDAIEKIQKLSTKEKYLVYCFHGNRSQYVVQLMEELGITEVFDLEGGINTWKKP